MMAARLDAGLYLNLFPVDMPPEPVTLLASARAAYPDLRPLRDELAQSGKRVWIYAEGDKVYGYGEDSDLLQSKGFDTTAISLPNVPRLASRMILEGFINHIKQEGYEPIERKGRSQVFNWGECQTIRAGNVHVYRGFDLRSLFVKDRETGRLVFGLVVDVTYAVRGPSDEPLSPGEIRRRFGERAVSEVRQAQGDLLPTGRINTEVARQRLLEHILPFVGRFLNFRLPCGIDVSLCPEPARIILGVERG
jgi:hypothetical protein